MYRLHTATRAHEQEQLLFPGEPKHTQWQERRMPIA